MLLDPMDGVRAGLRWILSVESDIAVVAEAAGVRAARQCPGEVIVAGVHFPDGVAADLTASGRPVVVHTWLPDDERDPAATRGAAAVVRHGRLRADLAPQIRRAAAAAAWSVLGR